MRAFLAVAVLACCTVVGCGSEDGPDPGSGGSGSGTQPECTTTGDCGLGKLCEAGKCVPGCEGGFWCPLGQYCPAGQCVPGCDSFTRCSVTQFCKAGVCVLDECLVDEDCELRGGSYCTYEGSCL